MCELRVRRIVLVSSSEESKGEFIKRLAGHIDPIKSTKLKINEVVVLQADSLYAFSRAMH